MFYTSSINLLIFSWSVRLSLHHLIHLLQRGKVLNSFFYIILIEPTWAMKKGWDSSVVSSCLPIKGLTTSLPSRYQRGDSLPENLAHDHLHPLCTPECRHKANPQQIIRHLTMNLHQVCQPIASSNPPRLGETNTPTFWHFRTLSQGCLFQVAFVFTWAKTKPMVCSSDTAVSLPLLWSIVQYLNLCQSATPDSLGMIIFSPCHELFPPKFQVGATRFASASVKIAD